MGEAAVSAWTLLHDLSQAQAHELQANHAKNLEWLYAEASKICNELSLSVKIEPKRQLQPPVFTSAYVKKRKLSALSSSRSHVQEAPVIQSEGAQIRRRVMVKRTRLVWRPKAQAASDHEQDEEMDVDSMRVVELKAALKKRKLEVRGLKAVLAKRLRDALEEERNKAVEMEQVEEEYEEEIDASSPSQSMATEAATNTTENEHEEPSTDASMSISAADAAAVDEIVRESMDNWSPFKKIARQSIDNWSPFRKRSPASNATPATTTLLPATAEVSKAPTPEHAVDNQAVEAQPQDQEERSTESQGAATTRVARVTNSSSPTLNSITNVDADQVPEIQEELTQPTKALPSETILDESANGYTDTSDASMDYREHPSKEFLDMLRTSKSLDGGKAQMAFNERTSAMRSSFNPSSQFLSKASAGSKPALKVSFAQGKHDVMADESEPMQVDEATPEELLAQDRIRARSLSLPRPDASRNASTPVTPSTTVASDALLVVVPAVIEQELTEEERIERENQAFVEREVQRIRLAAKMSAKKRLEEAKASTLFWAKREQMKQSESSSNSSELAATVSSATISNSTPVLSSKSTQLASQAHSLAPEPAIKVQTEVQLRTESKPASDPASLLFVEAESKPSAASADVAVKPVEPAAVDIGNAPRKPSNLVSGLHSLTSLIDKDNLTNNTSARNAPVVSALKIAEKTKLQEQKKAQEKTKRKEALMKKYEEQRRMDEEKRKADEEKKKQQAVAKDRADRETKLKRDQEKKQREMELAKSRHQKLQEMRAGLEKKRAQLAAEKAAARRPAGVPMTKTGGGLSAFTEASQDAAISSHNDRKKQAPQAQAREIVTYEISDGGESSGSESYDSQDESSKRAKKIPKWAQRENLERTLREQFGPNASDPTPSIFPDFVDTCDLEAIFQPTDVRKKKRFAKRSSSGNWFGDRPTARERAVYKQDMGFGR